MGVLISKLLTSFYEREAKIIMVGLDAAGKTTILYRMKLGEVITTTPTIGFNVEKFKYKNLQMTCWDIGGQDILRRLWYHYYDNCDAVIYVFDSNDPDRVELAREEVRKILTEDRLKDAILLVYANKQDLPHALSTAEVASALGLKDISKSRQWFVQGCCALNSEGLNEGLEWLDRTLKQKAVDRR